MRFSHDLSTAVLVCIIYCAHFPIIHSAVLLEASSQPLGPGFTVVGSFQINFNLSGGIPGCTNCGAPAAYACSRNINGTHPIGDWHEGKFTFKDQVPPGMKALQAHMVTQGAYNCDYDGNSAVSLVVNGDTLLTRYPNGGGDHCACGTCNGFRKFCGRHPLGLPKYVYGGVNELWVNVMGGASCFHNISLTIDYGYPLNLTKSSSETQYLIVQEPDQGSCLDGDDNSALAVTFQDPLPATGYILIHTQVSVYGYLCTQGYNVTTSLGVINVGDVAVPQGILNNQCATFADDIDFYCKGVTSASQYYQTGWPEYKYGSQNQVQIALYETEPTHLSRATSTPLRKPRAPRVQGDTFAVLCATRVEIILTAYKYSD